MTEGDSGGIHPGAHGADEGGLAARISREMCDGGQVWEDITKLWGCLHEMHGIF